MPGQLSPGHRRQHTHSAEEGPWAWPVPEAVSCPCEGLFQHPVSDVARWGTWLCRTWEVMFLNRFLDQLFGGVESRTRPEDAECHLTVHRSVCVSLVGIFAY